MDKKLSDDMFKLVRYKVLFVKRDHEVLFLEGEELVADNLHEADFCAWKIAEFLRELDRHEVAVPPKWQTIGFPPKEYVRGGKLIGLPDEDKKFLRIYHEVLERYPRERIQNDQDQVRILKGIRCASS
jgi:hypothetical protein